MKQARRKRNDVSAGSAALAAVDVSAVAGAAANSAESEGLPVSDAAVSDAGNKPPAADSVPAPASSDPKAHMHKLSPSCTVRDSLALKSALLDLLMDRRPVTIDVGAVERVDTAALQVLCAFVRDRKAAGGQVLWVGCTESFCEAIRLLGLQRALAIPDTQLIGVAA